MIPVQFITHRNERFGYFDGAHMALEGGCKWIQLRMKGATDDEVRAAAAVILPLCKQHEAVFVIDDRVALAKELKADGVHLGKNDMPVGEARHVLGEDFIIGGTANTFGDIERLHREGADYIGCGPFRFTTTKQNLAPVLGLEGYFTLVNRMRAAGILLPVVAIGGISERNIGQLAGSGVDGVAVVSAIFAQPDPGAAAKRLRALAEELTAHG